jgi:hypothetical protein
MLRIVTIPLLANNPSPLPRLNAPPVYASLLPEYNCILPPAPLVPLPTVKSTMPPRPSVAAPEPSLKAPLFPLLAEPELNTNIPLLPLPPALMLRMVTMPLDVPVPSPLDKLSAPPVFSELRPA